MTNYLRLAEVDDPTRPWRRVYHCPATDIYVKVYAKRHPRSALGSLIWEVTGSHCDENGAALKRGDGAPAVLGGAERPHAHLLQIASEPSANDVEPIADLLEREILFMVARVERAVLNEREAAALLG